MKHYTIKLDDTPTYLARRGSFIDFPTNVGLVGLAPEQRTTGVLEIILVHRKTEKTETCNYGVSEVRPDYFGTRKFVLSKQSDPATSYEVTVGGILKCTCDAGTKGVRRECKHLSALLYLVGVANLPEKFPASS